MSLTKIITIFILILVLFAGYVAYQFTSSTDKHPTQSTSKSKITINGHTFHVELAKTPADQQRGLSNRKSLAEDNGMLFLFTKSDLYPFWMKEMKFALDMIYLEGDKIVYIAADVPPPAKSEDTPAIIHPDAKADKVLEINAGLSKKYDIKKGDSVKIEL